MEGVSRSLCLLVGNFLGILASARGDADVSCVFMESCVLPCSFLSGSDEVIHWIQPAGNIMVHSYYNNQDQLADQKQRFRGRTSLFKDQISRGNASLELTGVQVQDQGSYRCHTSTRNGNKESFVNVMVDAPVQKVDIQQVKNRLTCSSEGIYPEPELTWSTSPPSSETFNKTTTVQQTEQQLYSISSSLIASDSGSELDYTCTVSARSRKRATLRQLSSIRGSSADTRIPCRASNTTLLGFSLVWRFNRSQIILNQTGANVSRLVSEQWGRQVKGVSESGGLVLQSLSSKQEGMYTCELSNDEETYVASTFLRLQHGSQNIVAGVAVGVTVGVVSAIVLTGVGLYCRWKQQERRRDV